MTNPVVIATGAESNGVEFNSTKRIFISTGEVSGDLNGSLLVEALQKQAANTGISLDIVALGGDRMAATGIKMLGKTDSIGSIGLLEALPFVWSTLRIQQLAKRWLVNHPPDLIVMIDYLAPNLSIGNFARQRFPTIPTVFYIAPQEWVWSLGSRNTNTLVNITDRLLAIFPQEATYYRERGATVTWVGHPLVDWVKRFPSRSDARQRLGIADEQTAIALLPASRRQELTYLMPVIFEAAQRIQAQVPNAHFWIPLALETYRLQIEQAIAQYQLTATVVTEERQAVIAAADLAISKSGTVNLELALMNIPQLVLYRVNPLTAWVANHLLNFSVPFVSPPNLVLMESIVPEFLQESATPEALTEAAMTLLTDPGAQQTMRQNYARMRESLGATGVCDRAAHCILELLISQSV